MKSYSLPQAGIVKIRRRIFGLAIVFILIALGIAFGFVFIQSRPTNLVGFIIVIPLLVGVVYLTIRRSIKQQEEVLRSIRIELDEASVTRRQLRIDGVQIGRGEVTAIREGSYGLLVMTREKSRSLVVPLDLDPSAYAEIRGLLSTWMPIQPDTGQHSLKNLVIGGLTLIGFGVIFFSASVWLIGIAGLLLVFLMVLFIFNSGGITASILN